MRVEKAENGYFVETIHGCWVYKDFEGVISFMRHVFGESDLVENSE